MARTRKAEATGTVQARHNLERDRQKAAREERAMIVEETVASQKATAKFLASKPTDTRGLER